MNARRFELRTRRGRAVVRMRNGDPFAYTTEHTARAGRRILAEVLGEPLEIVEVR